MRLIDITSLRRDERGDTIIQFVLVLPLFLILIFGSYEVWKLVHLKQSLEAATIQAARYLSMEGPFFLDEYPDGWRQRAYVIIARELVNEPLLQNASARLEVDVGTKFALGRPECPGRDATRARYALDRAERAQFAVYSRLEFPSPFRIPLVGTAENVVLTETHWHYLECAPNDVSPTPTPRP